MRSRFLWLVGLACANLAPAQVASFSGPVEAYAFDLPTRSVRPVIGFPGSSSFGPAIVEDLDFGSVAPQQSYAIVLKGVVWQLASHLDSARPSAQTLTGITARPQGVAWSDDGSLAILYSLAGNWIQTVSGLPTQPAVGTRTDVSTVGLLAAAVSDAKGKQIAVAVTGSSPGVFLFEAATRTFQALLPLSSPAALAFSGDGTELYAIDSSTKQLSAVKVANLGSQTVSLAGLANPFAVRCAPLTSAGQVVYVASRGDQILREYNFTSRQTVADLPLSFAPAGLDEFGRNSFMVAPRASASDPLWLFVDAPQPAIYFVPALPEQPVRPERGDRAR
ncbi:MAG: hypothetical protein ABSB86_14010 [Bryobacteraceae bacterium]